MRSRLMKFLFRESTPSWQDVERYDPAWKIRIERMASHVDPDDASIVDVGCGPMWLREYIPAEMKYIGIDYVARDAGTLVCDLNKDKIPNVLADVWFVSGCLEYLTDPSSFIKVVSDNAKKCILSYCDLRNFPSREEREKRGWKNHLASDDILSLFSRHGMVEVESEFSPSGDSIFVFKHK